MMAAGTGSGPHFLIQTPVSLHLVDTYTHIDAHMYSTITALHTHQPHWCTTYWHTQTHKHTHISAVYQHN